MRDEELVAGVVARKTTRRADFGFRKRLMNLYLEPENPFDSTEPRPIRRIPGTLGLLTLCVAGFVFYFHTTL